MKGANDQRKSLLLQGSAVRIPAFPSFFATVRQFNYETKREDDFGKTRKAGAAMDVGKTGRRTWNG